MEIGDIRELNCASHEKPPRDRARRFAGPAPPVRVHMGSGRSTRDINPEKTGFCHSPPDLLDHI